MAVIAPLLIVAGLAVIGYSFLMGDPFATSAFFGAEPPSNSAMKLTVPEMQRVKEVPVYDGAMHDDGALHVRSTGFPWQHGSNVYIAGHRMGFPGTKSYLVFWDLNKLEKGDEIILTDANGTAYTYGVYKSIIIDPDASYITRPVPGKSIIS